MPQLKDAAYNFASQALPKDTFTVVRFSGKEGLSTLYHFEILLVSEREDIDLTTMLQNPATFTIKGHFSGGEDMPFHGILSAFEQMHQAGIYFFYRAELRPKLWWLTLTQHNQIFLNKKVDKFLEDVLKDGGLSMGPDFTFQFQGKYQPWEYVCQYGESHFNFVSRWMEREGAYYWFEQGEQSEKMIASDTFIAHAALAGHETFLYSPPSGLDAADVDKVINRFTLKQSPLPKNVLLKDYNYMKPSLDLEGKATVQDKGRGEIYLYGENFANKIEGERLAQVRAEEYQCREKVFHGLSSIPAIRPGYLFSLSRHFRDEFNQQYLTTLVHHEGSQERYLLSGLGVQDLGNRDALFYRNTFECIPGTTQFRPQRLSPKPRIAGTISAKVDAAGSDKYAELDEHGRYKVTLPFDLSGRGEGKASCWLRMATPYAGEGHGMHFPLHKGTEVLLTFLDGDPDRPVIQSAVPNSETPSVVTSAGQTSSRIESSSGHKVVLQDQEGKEGIGMFASDGAGDGSWMWMGKRSPQVFSLSTKGAKHEVVTGQSSSTVIGASNSATLGSSLTATIGMATQFTAATKFALEFSDSFTYNAGKNYQFGGPKETLRDTFEVLGKDNVTLKSGLSVTQKKAYDGAYKNIGIALASIGALLGSAGGDIVASASFPEAKENSSEVWKGLVSLAPVALGIAIQVTTMEGLMKSLIQTLEDAKSEIKLSPEGILVQADNSAAEGIKLTVRPASTAVDQTSSLIDIIPKDENSIILQRTTGGKVVVEKNGVSLEKTGGASIHVENDTGADAGKVVLTKGAGKIIVDDGNVTAQASTGSGGRMTLTGTTATMEQGGKKITIDNGSIKITFGSQALTLNSAAISAQGNFIKLG